MPEVMTRGDSIREYLTGVTVDGGTQADYLLSLGNKRSSSEIMSYGILLNTPLSSISVDFASSGCASGTGTLVCVDSDHVAWGDSITDIGEPAYLPGISSQAIVEAKGRASSFVRVTRLSNDPISGGPCNVVLSVRRNNAIGFDNVTSEQADNGENQYLGIIIRNESSSPVSSFKRWVSTLGLRQICDTGLGATGSGTITTTGSFASWPSTGWCRVSLSSGTLKEIVYYTSRTNSTLSIQTTGRALIGTIATIGAGSDFLDAVPGIALASDPTGVQAWGSGIQTIANINSEPVGVTWKTGITNASGIGPYNIGVGQQLGVWLWRQIPAGAKATPFALNRFSQSFDAF